ncbi:MAG TPA: transglycosylase SLT domain-containing protein [Caulobacterales bacterium]|nr:transglycosylase SLT domain-containing protein [Caulobacterales bacterium]
MRRRDFIVGMAAMAALASGCTTHATPEEPGDACDMFRNQGGWWRAVKSAERRWGAPPALQLAIIRQESGFRYRARPPRRRILWIIPGPHQTSAHGYAQALNSTWDEYKRARGDDGVDRTEFSDATDFVAWYCSVTQRQLGVDYSDARGHYLAYHEGRGGYSRRTYQGDAGLLAAAARVQSYRDAYQAQLDRCSGQLNRWWWPF